MQFIRPITVALAAAAMTAATPALASTNIVLNGSFESGISPGSFTTVNAIDTTSITDWNVSVGSVDYIGSYWQAQDGERSIDLAGNSNGTLMQTLATVVGQVYNLSFYVARNPDGGVDPRTGFVTYNGVPTLFTYLNTGSTKTNMEWQLVSYLFTATTAATLVAGRRARTIAPPPCNS